MITIERKNSISGDWLYRVWPDNHSDCFPEPSWLPARDFCDAIKGAINAAFLIVDSNAHAFNFTQEEWGRFFETASLAHELEDQLIINGRPERSTKSGVLRI